MNRELSGTAAEIWNDIKDLELNLFGLPNQFVSVNCFPEVIEPSKLYVTIKNAVVFPVLEDLLKDKYEVKQSYRFLTISKKVVLL
jgi:hypothetical protein